MELGPRHMALLLLVLISLMVFEFGYFNTRPSIIVNGGGGVGLNHCQAPMQNAICDPNSNGSSGLGSTAKCLAGQTVTNVTESSSGTITLVCASSAGDVVSTFQCPGTSGSTLQYAYNISETTAGAVSFLCKQVAWGELTGIPTSVCGAGTYLTAISPLTCTSAISGKEEQGTVTCILGAGIFTCSSTVTFSPTFTNLPEVFLSENVSSPTSLLSVPWSILASSTTSVWIKMPAAQTELFGTSTNRINPPLVAWTNALLSVWIATPGAAGAFLWAECHNPNGNDYNLTSAYPISSTGFANAAAQSQVANCVGASYVKIIGGGGNGSTSPAFGTLSLILQYNGPITDVQSGLVTKTGFTYYCDINIPTQVSINCASTWLAKSA